LRIKADKQMLVILSRHRVVKDMMSKSIADIRFGDAVPESRLIKLNAGVHGHIMIKAPVRE
jgi:hypothetical protein